MNKIRIIDLLNKIANGEEVPEKIKYNDDEFYYSKGFNDYMSDNECTLLFVLTYDNRGLYILNETVEIIEDEDINIQDIEEIKDIIAISEEGYMTKETFIDYSNKINDLIKAVKKLDKEINK